MGLGLIHLSKRKKQLAEHLPFVSRKMAVLDDLGYVIGVISALANIPQLLQIWVNKNAAGVSSISWVIFSLTSLFWFYYGIQHKQKVLIFTYSAVFVLQALIAIGTLIY